MTIPPTIILGRSRGGGKVAAIGLASVLLVLFFQAPHLQLITEVRPGTFMWTRAITFLQQCESPFRTDIETAMQFRIGPPLVAHTLRLPGLTPLVIPWVGVGFLITYVALILRRESGSDRAAWIGTIIVAATSAVLVPLHWMGINDAWVWMGLLVVSFSPHRPALVAALLLAPWVDERFIIGLPLAWIIRSIHGTSTDSRSDYWTLLGLLPYVMLRAMHSGIPFTGSVEQGFLESHLATLPRRISFAPLGWWMGLRLAWVPVMVLVLHQSGWRRWTILGIAAGTLAISTVLASDVSRSSAILLPMVLAGSLVCWDKHADWIKSHIKTIAATCLLLPAAHVVHNKIDPIEPLVLELARWIVKG